MRITRAGGPVSEARAPASPRRGSVTLRACLAAGVLLVVPASASAAPVERVDVGGTPRDITSAYGALWFTDVDGAGPGGSIGRVTPGSPAAVARFNNATGVPFAITTATDGRVWFVENGTDTDGDSSGGVVRVAADGTLQRFTADATPAGPDPFDPIQSTLSDIAPLESGALVAPYGDDGVVRVNPNGGLRAAEGVFDRGSAQSLAAQSGTTVWAALQGDGAAARVEVGQLTGGTGPEADPEIGITEDADDVAVAGNGRVYVSSPDADGPGIARVDDAGTGVIDFRQAGRLPLGSQPTGITRGPDGAVWFTDTGLLTSGIYRIDPQTDAVVKRSDDSLLTGSPQRITTGPDGALWFTLPGDGDVGRLAAVPLGQAPPADGESAAPPPPTAPTPSAPTPVAAPATAPTVTQRLVAQRGSELVRLRADVGGVTGEVLVRTVCTTPGGRSAGQSPERRAGSPGTVEAVAGGLRAATAYRCRVEVRSGDLVGRGAPVSVRTARRRVRVLVPDRLVVRAPRRAVVPVRLSDAARLSVSISPVGSSAGATRLRPVRAARRTVRGGRRGTNRIVLARLPAGRWRVVVRTAADDVAPARAAALLTVRPRADLTPAFTG